MNKRPYRLEFFTDAKGEHRWRVKAGNNRIVATSGEGYTRYEDCTKAAFKLFDALNAGELVVA